MTHNSDPCYPANDQKNTCYYQMLLQSVCTNAECRLHTAGGVGLSFLDRFSNISALLTTITKTLIYPAFSLWLSRLFYHLFTTNPFLRPFERRESCCKCFFSSSNVWRHPLKIFRKPFEWLAWSLRKSFRWPFERLASSVRNFSVAVRTVFQTVWNGWNTRFSSVR